MRNLFNLRKSKGEEGGLQTLQQVINRLWLARKLGYQYKGKRNVYDALGYPQDSELNFQYYFNKYDRQDIASAIIDRPVDAAWNGLIGVCSVKEDEKEKDTLKDAWIKLEKGFGLNYEFNRLDKLTGLGEFAILLLGFNDVKKPEGWKKPLTGAPKLLYVNSFAQRDIHIIEWEKQPDNSRYGQPLMYSLDITTPGQMESKGMTEQLQVHYSRVIHVCESSMISSIYGTPRLKAIVNRLIDLEKLLGGDAEMFWKGARPGYFGKIDKDANMSDDEWDELTDQIENYEHDLIRFLHAQGMDIHSLAQQVADPSNHIDAQIQAISAKTEIPKRILVGSERGELSSEQDIIQWRTKIKTKQRRFCEPKILRPFIDKCMRHGVLPDVEDYVIEWEDLFAPSEKERAEVGKTRAGALESWSKSMLNIDALPPELVPKLLLGLNDDQVDEVEQARERQIEEEEEEIENIEQEETVIEK